MAYEEEALFAAGVNPNTGMAAPAGPGRRDRSYREPQAGRRPFGYLRERSGQRKREHRKGAFRSRLSKSPAKRG